MLIDTNINTVMDNILLEAVAVVLKVLELINGKKENWYNHTECRKLSYGCMVIDEVTSCNWGSHPRRKYLWYDIICSWGSHSNVRGRRSRNYSQGSRVFGIGTGIRTIEIGTKLMVKMFMIISVKNTLFSVSVVLIDLVIIVSVKSMPWRKLVCRSVC